MAEGIQLHYKRRAPLGLSRPAGIGGRGNGSMLGSQQQQQQAAAASAPAAVVHCLHGFGASSYRQGEVAVAGWEQPDCFICACRLPVLPLAAVRCLVFLCLGCCSWSFVQQEMADALHAVVTAHDMPGFGLSQRCAAGAWTGQLLLWLHRSGTRHS